MAINHIMHSSDFRGTQICGEDGMLVDQTTKLLPMIFPHTMSNPKCLHTMPLT